MFFQHKLTKAVEASARYMGRSWNAVDAASCAAGAQWGTATTFAANLAVNGDAAGNGSQLFPGFSATNLTFSSEMRNIPDAGDVCVVRVEAKVPYLGIFGNDLVPVLGISQPVLNATSEERYVGD